MRFVSSLSKLSKNFYIFLAIGTLFALANFSYMFFVLKTTTIFSNRGGYILPIIPIALYVLFNVFYTLFAIPFGKWSDVVGRKRVLTIGYLLFSVVCLGFIFFSSFPAFIALFILYGLVYAMLVGNQRAMISDLSPNNLRATALGLFQTVVGLAAIATGIFSGWLYDINSNYTFLFGAITSFVSMLLLLFVKKFN